MGEAANSVSVRVCVCMWVSEYMYVLEKYVLEVEVYVCMGKCVCYVE